MEESQSRGDPGCASLSPPISHMQREDQKRGRGQKGPIRPSFHSLFWVPYCFFMNYIKKVKGTDCSKTVPQVWDARVKFASPLIFCYKPQHERALGRWSSFIHCLQNIKRPLGSQRIAQTVKGKPLNQGLLWGLRSLEEKILGLHWTENNLIPQWS